MKTKLLILIFSFLVFASMVFSQDSTVDVSIGRIIKSGNILEYPVVSVQYRNKKSLRLYVISDEILIKNDIVIGFIDKDNKFVLIERLGKWNDNKKN